MWLDTTANGIQDGGEAGVPGVLVNLYREPHPPFDPAKASTLVASDVTDTAGHYDFAVEPGHYYLEVVCADGAFTAGDAGPSDGHDSDVDPATGTTSPFAIGIGELDATRDAGLLDPDGDGVVCADNCPADDNPGQEDGDGDGVGDACDLCLGDDATGDGDGICADLDCDDADGTDACADFADGFETGDTTAWSAAVP